MSDGLFTFQAIASYRAALDAAEQLDPGIRRTTSFAHAGKSLAKLLVSLGQPGSAHDVEARVARLDADRAAPSAREVSP